MRGPAAARATGLEGGTAATPYVAAAAPVGAVKAKNPLGSVPFGEISLVEAAGIAARFVAGEAIVTAGEAAATFVSAFSDGRSPTTGVMLGGT